MTESAPANGAAVTPTATAEPTNPDDLVLVTKAVGDPLRARVLRVLREESYGVLELARILDCAQPALSHHLKILHRAGLVSRRREGNTLFYRRAPAPTALRHALLEAVDDLPLPFAQQAQIEAVHAERRQRSEDFFSAHAGDFASNQARISEAKVYAGSVVDIVDRHGLGRGTALDIGPGDGELLEPLAGRFDAVVGIDSARGMLERSVERAALLDNVKLKHRDFSDLPERPRYQLVVAAMVLHHQPSPQRFFHHARRLLKRGGMLVVVELCRHDHEWARTACGDLWLGFEPGELTAWGGNAGLAHGEAQFLAQKNGFRIQIHTFHLEPR